MEAYIFETSGGLKADDKHSRAVRISSARGLDATRMSQTSLKALEDIEEAPLFPFRLGGVPGGVLKIGLANGSHELTPPGSS